jgi:hypothetical protein
MRGSSLYHSLEYRRHPGIFSVDEKKERSNQVGALSKPTSSDLTRDNLTKEKNVFSVEMECVRSLASTMPILQCKSKKQRLAPPVYKCHTTTPMFHGRPPSQDAEAEDSRQPALGIALLEFGRDVAGGVAIPPPELRLSIEVGHRRLMI